MSYIKLSARNYAQGMENLNLLLNLFTVCCYVMKNIGEVEMLIRTLSRDERLKFNIFVVRLLCWFLGYG